MEVCHHDQHQDRCTSTNHEQGQEREYLQDELQQLRMGQGAQVEVVSFADLPQPWLKLLVHQLDPQDRLALFRTCSGVAAAVVQHSSRLTLKPDAALQQDSSRRTFVLKLAANSSNICLGATGHAVPLDVPDVWQGIKQLTLRDISLTADTISTLHLQQLKHLHTTQFKAWSGGVAVNSEAVQHLLPADSLPALRNLNTAESEPTAELRLLKQLGPVMGHRVTELIVGSCLAITAIDKWPTLQKVMQGPFGPQEPAAACSAAVKQVFTHPQLQTVVVPSDMFMVTNPSIARGYASFSPGKLEVLELTHPKPPSLRAILGAPLHAVKHLRVHTGLSTMNGMSATTVKHLRQCNRVEIVPGKWGDLSQYDFDSNAGSTPTWEVTFDPLLLIWLLPSLSSAEGAFILTSDPAGSTVGPLTRLHIPSLRLLPPGIHTLVFDSCAMDGDCTWAQLVAQVPQHVQSLLLRQCAMPQEEFEAVLAQPPPSGLKRLYLAQDRYNMPWVVENEEAVRAAVAAKWPDVQLQLDLRPSWEDEWDDQMNEAAENGDYDDFDPQLHGDAYDYFDEDFPHEEGEQ